ncbi:hypothetical protein NQ318_011039 [Aromia moschata]|uniref:Integrin beta n=1 Tax=Aromia moschata TaxID=1265417 RepID=A0AAV8YRJ9_9CUCU|nr:hypothetical protein NQ318_011039 [Aromia moschata]
MHNYRRVTFKGLNKYGTCFGSQSSRPPPRWPSHGHLEYGIPIRGRLEDERPKKQTQGKVPVHCAHKNISSDSWCSDGLISPSSSRSTLQNKLFSSANDDPIQLRPQRIQLSQAENYPVDLYYIMDLSASMEQHRKKLGTLGVKLAEALKNITNNVRIGFGSFIDKVDLPFVSTFPDKLKRPCKLGKINCVSPYSFKNHLNLSTNYEAFKKQVTDARVSGNLDAPEGGLDAIMQAIVCKEHIGWRSQARHLLVFSTDAEFHIAGDGKLAGVIEPNDAKCHMLNNLYTDYLKYDYPSVSQINYVARENNINIIFAIVKKDGNIKQSYQKLSDRIENSNFGELQENDNSVINLVVSNYKKIVQYVTLTSNASDDVDIKFSTNCKSPRPNGCSNVHVGEIVDFTATIQPLDILECSASGPTKRIISIKPDALDESLIIELDVICNCPCSSSNDSTYRPNSRECSGHGDLECGICKCDPGRFGRSCQCDSSSSLSEDTTNCQKNEKSEICSAPDLATLRRRDLEGRCGKCECNSRPNPNEKISGIFCECNNYSCKRDGGLLCSGKGTCNCGKCECYAGYTGEACECPDSNSTCIAPGGELVCSGYGRCDCGQCECNVAAGHSGKYCEECTTCPAQRCEELRHCVECQAYQTGAYNQDECKINCTAFLTQVVDKFDDNDDSDIKKCRVPDKMGCIIIFEYTYDENKELVVRAQKERLCAGPPNVLAWILAVIGTILLAGLILLIVWKVCTTVHDRREYAKFENERKALKWHRNDNPLYKGANLEYANPVYNRSSRLSSK